MIWVPLLVLALSVLGLPILRVFCPSSDVTSAPAYGLAAVVLVAYTISANFGLTGADSTALSIIAWTVVALVWLLHTALKKPASRYSVNYRKLVPLLAIAPALLILIPAARYGMPNFFGSVNFDFFYNSRDADYLTNHTALQFTGKTEEILPFIWSSDEQGRFGINFLSAFFVKFVGFNAVHFNAVLISTLIVINSLAFYSVSRELFKYSRAVSVASVFCIILSAGFAQGYSYYLLGQISAMPLLSLSLIAGRRAILPASDDPSRVHSLTAIIFLLNALYVFYAILAVFGALIIGLALILSTMLRRVPLRRFLLISSLLACGTLGLFILLRLFSLDALMQSVMSWISLSLKTASADGSSPAIFSEYTLEPFLLLLFGVVSYPATQSLMSLLVGFGPNRGLILIVVGLLTFVCFVFALLSCFKYSRLRWPEMAIISSITLISLVSSFVFFITGSGYSIFKISNWLIPYLMPVFLSAILVALEFRGKRRTIVALLSAIVLAANITTAGAYTSPFWLFSKSERGVNARKVNGMKGVNELKAALLPYPHADLSFDLKNGIRNAWIANEFAADRNVGSLTNNLQPLADRRLPAIPCGERRWLSEGTILIADAEAQDIFAAGVKSNAFFVGQSYSAAFVSDIDQYAYLGRGAYLVETVPLGVSIADGFPRTFRWVERGVELFYFTRVSGKIDLSFDVAPGYVDGPTPRNLTLSAPGITSQATFDQHRWHLQFKSLRVSPGLNCFYIESPDRVAAKPRFGAVVRAGTQIDFRLLSFAIANIGIFQRN
ncbi:hypothetical protein SAMN05216228_101578 [Rhizobium tibeticum]|uniref:Uncharacterized protein n=1 Tax=Rhizobium tibeticum TaxID=501024 RepID=A0A1H8NTS3_9HYPH|nr:hypothetical protein [Rhizobium tibeticum]SEI00370.1 hypothetical protein RTCCBAU85039_3630 [Rhizobium tibeticum]SEO33050.1 hypothetical protein SAMN05216228_101578 [Rhizobium tibeticum]